MYKSIGSFHSKNVEDLMKISTRPATGFAVKRTYSSVGRLSTTRRSKELGVP